MQQNKVPLILGGDHSVALGTIAGIAKHFKNQNKKIGVLWFDAHGDINTPETSLTGNLHGMPLAHLLGLGHHQLNHLIDDSNDPILDFANIAIIGVRDLDLAEKEIIKKHNILCFTMEEVSHHGVANVVNYCIQQISKNTAGFHLSWDFDWMDPQQIAAVNTPVQNGASLLEAQEALQIILQNHQLLSMEFVEYNPLMDHNGQTYRWIEKCFEALEMVY